MVRIQPRLPRGGEWLLEPGAPGAVFTPERASEEQRLIARTAAEFVTREVLPALDRLEQKDWTLARRLLARCGELGLLGIELPERDGGGGLDVASSMMAGEQISRSASFGATYGAQANLTLIPLHLFGTDAQKRKYLPRLLSGELVGKAAELGLLGVDVPEAYGGLGLDKATSLVVSEKLARSASFGADAISGPIWSRV